jgi:ABC-type multidrug transport system ATPase subunit
MVIVAEVLCKTYGRCHALNRVSFSTGPGITALLGPNGAGKTTLLNILATLVEPTSGRVRVGPYDVCRQRREVRQSLGFLPQEFGLYESLTAYEFLEYFALLKGVSNRRRCVQLVLEQVGLESESQHRVGTFSGGMRQRLGPAQALLNMPPVLIFDEPTAGLDPAERNRFRQFLLQQGDGRTVLLSTHLIQDVSLAAHRVIVLHQGQIRFDGSVQEMLRTASGKVWRVRLPRHQLEAFQQQHSVTHFVVEADLCTANFLSDSPPQLSAEPVQPSLEEAYLRMIQTGP